MKRCKHNCCTRTFVPLTLAYARTIHKFQGLSAGPVDVGRVPNAYECIICDPDEKKFENGALGLFYTALSRATTLGDDNGVGSAIYFTGPEMNEHRIRRLRRKPKDNSDFEVALQRENWVEYLNINTKKTLRSINKDTNYIHETLKWGDSFRFSYDALFHRHIKYNEDKFKI